MSGVALAAPDTPRGIRNNNPGNLVHTNDTWLGEVECDDKTFSCFSDPRYGIRAIGILARTYHEQYGIKDLQGFVGRYSPSSENETEQLVETYRELLKGIESVGPHNLEYLVQAVVVVENGFDPYGLDYIREALDAHTSGDNHTSWFVIDRRANEDVGDEAGVTKSTVRSSSQEQRSGNTGQDRSQEGWWRTLRVDSSSHGLEHSLQCNRYPEVSNHLWVDRPIHNDGMDRVERRIPILHRRQGSLEVADRRRYSDNTSGHPFGKRYRRSILRRKSHRPQW